MTEVVTLGECPAMGDQTGLPDRASLAAILGAGSWPGGGPDTIR